MVILTHSFPDLDAIASAWGLKTLIETSVRIPCRVIAGGDVLHAENIKFIEMLRPPLELVVSYHPDVNDKIVFSDRPSFRIFPSTIRHRFFGSMGLVAD